MRKLMLGAVLLAAMLPVTTVYAAGEGTAKKSYTANKGSKAAKKNAEDAIAEAVKAGATVEEALAEIMEADPNNAPVAVAAAVKADPTNAKSITSFAIAKAPLQATAITSAALRAVTTPEARQAVAQAAKDSGVPVATINQQLADISSPKTSTTSSTDTPSGTTTTTTGSTTTTNNTSSSGGGGCDPKKASCT
jgi:nucleotide-binding universal stress UspA family protein